MVKNDDMKKKYYKAKEVAEILNVSENTIWTWIGTGKLGSVKIGKSRRVPVDFIEKMQQEDADAIKARAGTYEPGQVAGLLGISVKTVWAWVASGEIRSVKIGRNRRIPVDAVEEKIERGGA